MRSAKEELEKQTQEAKVASRKLSQLSTIAKNKALHSISDKLLDRKEEVLAANKKDCEEARAAGMNASMLDRLILTDERLASIASDVRSVEALPDPVGESFDSHTLPNGIQLSKKRVPIGVIASVYESRPNVTIDISTLCMKSGNAIILRGGKEALRSNAALVKIVQEASYSNGIPEGAIQFVKSPDRSLIIHLLKMREIIDLIIPRGGAGLVKIVRDNATVPIIASGTGVCHTYVDASANLDKATAIAYNAKVQRPSVCNAMECLLVHKDIAEDYLPMIALKWNEAGVEMHCDQRSFKILNPITSLKLIPAIEQDWGKEFLALIAAVRVVDSLDDAIHHIERYGSGHSEAIVADDYPSAMRFLNEVDAAAVYANASTRFTDGSQFGLGAEIGISTQKLHARGPLGLKELTTYKWVALGNGQVRP